MNKRIKNKRFTLLELLVAMAVFSVMMAVLMQFFSSGQKVSVKTKEKTQDYEDARLILEMVTRDLRTSKYVVPGSADQSVSFNGGALSFYCRSPYAKKPGEKVFVTYDGASYTCGTESGSLSSNVTEFKVTSDMSKNAYMPENVTVELTVGDNKYVKSIYIGGRGQ